MVLRLKEIIKLKEEKKQGIRDEDGKLTSKGRSLYAKSRAKAKKEKQENEVDGDPSTISISDSCSM